MPSRATVIGIGNPYRHDDGIGPAVVAELERLKIPGVRVALHDGEPAGLLDAWSDTRLAIIVDAVSCAPATPGRIHHSTVDDLSLDTGQTSSHGLGVPQAVLLAQALDRMPARLVVFAVEADNLDLGTGLSPAVTRAVPDVVHAIVDEITGITFNSGVYGDERRPRRR